MADKQYVLYDTLATGTGALDALLFQVASRGDATHTETYTNMQGAGSLPSGYKMVVNKLALLFSPAMAAADLAALFTGSIVQFIYANVVEFWSPLAIIIGYNAWTGWSNLTAGAGLQAAGSEGHGYDFNPAFEIAGGVQFAVRIKSTNATGVSTNLVIALVGTLTIPG